MSAAFHWWRKVNAQCLVNQSDLKTSIDSRESLLHCQCNPRFISSHLQNRFMTTTLSPAYHNPFMTPPLCNNMPNNAMTSSSRELLNDQNEVDAAAGIVCKGASSAPTAAACCVQQKNGGDNESPSSMAASCRSPQGVADTAATTDVSELVVKAKKAAALLWTILHAQVRYSALLYYSYLHSFA